jgi:mannosyl-oligosaccharide alpha-1,2-mannosidase
VWAAEGLAYTCWMTYAEQATGLGPDEMRMKAWATPGHGKWMTHVRAWEDAGRPGGVPPGLKEKGKEEPAKREYWAQKSTYLLRPEVCVFILLCG